MKILVCITHVPDTTTKIKFNDSNTELDATGVQFVTGPYDDYALSRSMELKEQLNATVTVLNVGTAETEPTIRKALALGADDAIRINAEPTDTYFVAQQIAHVCKENNYDLILMGRESIDFNGGQVHGIVGEILGIPSLSPIMQLDIEDNVAKMVREIEGGKEHLEASLPLILGCQEPIAEWKIPNMRGIMSARSKPLNVVEPVDPEKLTQVEQYELPAPKGECQMIAPEEVEKLIDLLKNEAKVL
ncbi:MAG: electron transfer flavoprotein subunit beta/FixA family protein [Thermonemataceae bacterium]